MANLTIELEDQGQDFLELEVDQKGVIDGYSIMFGGGKLTLLGIGTLDGKTYYTRQQVLQANFVFENDLYVYFKNTGDKDPLPWEAQTLKYRVVGVK